MSTIETLRAEIDALEGDENPVRRLLSPPGILIAPMALLLLCMFIGPMLAIVVFSFQTGNAIALNPLEWSIATYQEVIGGMASGEGVYGDVLVNTVAVSITTTALTLIVSYPAAYALAHKITRYKLVFLMILIIPLGIGLGAVAFRLESLWPLVLWHFAVDVTAGLVANPSPLMDLAAIALIFVVFVVGVGLLWQDRRLEAARAPVQAPVSD